MMFSHQFRRADVIVQVKIIENHVGMQLGVLIISK